MGNNRRKEQLVEVLRSLYRTYEETIPYHGWQHVWFVHQKTIEFARELKANEFIAATAALVHDLNYLIGKDSLPSAARDFRGQLLLEAGYRMTEVSQIESVVLESSMGRRIERDQQLSAEGMAVSDADSLFKFLPVTPVVFALSYMKENSIGIKELANRISTQRRLLDEDRCFYSRNAQRSFRRWAETNVSLWENMTKCLQDDDVCELLEEKGVIL